MCTVYVYVWLPQQVVRASACSGLMPSQSILVAPVTQILNGNFIKGRCPPSSNIIEYLVVAKEANVKFHFILIGLQMPTPSSHGACTVQPHQQWGTILSPARFGSMATSTWHLNVPLGQLKHLTAAGYFTFLPLYVVACVRACACVRVFVYICVCVYVCSCL